jgi:hypothetical protein
LTDVRVQVLDQQARSDHSYIEANDQIYFAHEYTSGAGFAGAGNDLILNLKKRMDRRGRPEWRHKERAIQTVSQLLAANLNKDWLRLGTLVPVPPSKMRSDPTYDDRMLRALHGIAQWHMIDVRELVRQKESTRASHESAGNRMRPADLLAVYEIDEAVANARPVSALLVVDDLLTTGAHYRAMHTILTERFPGAPIAGVFIARRRIIPAADAADADPF